MMPACAALPAWNGLVIEPKLDIRPADCDAPSAIATADFSGVQLAQLGTRRRRADRAIQPGRMPALLVQKPRIPPEQLGPGLIPGDIGGDHVRARGAQMLRLRQDGRDQHRAGMAAQRHVVIVQRMRRGAVDPGGLRGRGLARAERQCGRSVARCQRLASGCVRCLRRGRRSWCRSYRQSPCGRPARLPPASRFGDRSATNRPSERVNGIERSLRARRNSDHCSSGMATASLAGSVTRYRAIRPRVNRRPHVAPTRTATPSPPGATG